MAEETKYKPVSECLLFWLFRYYLVGAGGSPRFKVMESWILLHFVLKSQVQLVGWVKGYVSGSCFLHLLCAAEELNLSEKQKASEEEMRKHLISRGNKQ